MKKLVSLCLLAFVICLIPCTVGYSVVNPVVSITNPPSQDASAEGIGYIFDLCNTINSELQDAGFFNIPENATKEESEYTFCTATYTETSDVDKPTRTVTIAFNKTNYVKYDSGDKQKIMQIALDLVNESSVSNINKTKIYNAVCKFDETTSRLVKQLSDNVSADYLRAWDWFKPFSGLVGTILGGVTIFLFGFIAITLILDIAFITIPFFQYWVLNKQDGKDSSKKRKLGSLVSIEALNAVKTQESNNGMTNAMSLYLGSKTKQLVCLFICLLYLTSGKIYSVIASLIDYFSNF